MVDTRDRQVEQREPVALRGDLGCKVELAVVATSHCLLYNIVGPALQCARSLDLCARDVIVRIDDGAEVDHLGSIVGVAVGSIGGVQA